MTLLSAENLTVTFGHGAARQEVVRGLSLSIDRGETVALVGESGSGKSTTALALMQLLPFPHAQIPQGRIALNGAAIFESGQRGSANAYGKLSAVQNGGLHGGC